MWLGLDIGTSGSRALLVDSKGHVRQAFTAPHQEMAMARPLWAEQDPADWWKAAQAAVRGVLKLASIDGSAVRGVGLSGQMHGLVILDEQNHVIRPSLIWCDQRSQAQVDSINAAIGRQKILDYTANPVLTGFTLPKLLWVRDCEPQNFARVRKMLLPKDYVRFQLTGEFATDVSDASGTSLFDVVNRKWSAGMVSGLGLDPSILPAAYESSDVTGTISAVAATATGLKEGTPVVGGAGDQAASAIGNGIVMPGNVSCTVGTSGVVFAYLQKPAYDPAGRVHTFCHAVPGAWHVMGVTQGAGLSFQWFRNRLAPGAEYDDLTAEAIMAPAGAQGLFWLPYLMGERTPHLDALARAAWVGLTAKHNRSDLIRSILEGVSYSLRDCLEIIEGMGAPVTLVRLSGGGAGSPFWHQLFSDIFDKRVVTLETKEGSAYGAALLAVLGTGEYASALELCQVALRESVVKTPNPAAAAFYSRNYQVFRSLYPTLKATYQAIASLEAPAKA
jgi:xylulokinase